MHQDLIYIAEHKNVGIPYSTQETSEFTVDGRAVQKHSQFAASWVPPIDSQRSIASQFVPQPEYPRSHYFHRDGETMYLLHLRIDINTQYSTKCRITYIIRRIL